MNPSGIDAEEFFPRKRSHKNNLHCTGIGKKTSIGKTKKLMWGIEHWN